MTTQNVCIRCSKVQNPVSGVYVRGCCALRLEDVNAQIPLHKADVDRLKDRLGDRVWDHVESRGLQDPATFDAYCADPALQMLRINVESTDFQAHFLRLSDHPSDPDFLVCTLLEDEKGCAVGEDRPLLCRTYPITVDERGNLTLLSDDSYCLAVHEDAMTGALDDAQRPFSGVRQRLNIKDVDVVELILRRDGRAR